MEQESLASSVDGGSAASAQPDSAQTHDRRFTPYSATARGFHWLTVVATAVLVASGLVMVYRGKDLNIWDGLTNTLYASHKALGFVVLVIVVLRLVYRLMHGAPPDAPTLTPVQRSASHALHWLFYGVLLVLPLLGWIGISMFPALDLFAGIKAPALTVPDQAMSKQVLWLHASLAYLLIVLIVMHVAAALFHHFIRGDDVLRRMLPGLGKRN